MPKRFGVLLAGGKGERLRPTTLAVNKHLLPVYDKPMLHYALSTLMLTGVREVAIVVRPRDRHRMARLYGDGSPLGMRIDYVPQAEPRGIVDGMLAARSFIDDRPSVLVLGDNFFFGHGLQGQLAQADDRSSGATILTYRVKDPRAYGVLEIDADGNPIAVEEKPLEPQSDLAITGLYFFDPQVLQFAAELTPSLRGELEVTGLLQRYLQVGQLHQLPLGRGSFWLDMGTESRLLQAANFVQSLQARQGWRICCPEEVAFRKGFIDQAALRRLARRFANPYGRYLEEVAAGMERSS